MRKRFMRGGIYNITPQFMNDLIYIWNTFFKNKAIGTSLNDRITQNQPDDFFKEYLVAKRSKTQLQTKKALFIIDMQNDFLDRNYNRKDSNEKNVVNGMFLNGNFDVAGGASMITNGRLQKYIKQAIECENYTNVIFSRDYHPIGHCSFSNAFQDKYSHGVVGGNFPSHCVQGETGAELIAEMKALITGASTANKDKIKIVFKGMHKDGDSFTAVKKDTIDYIASNSGGPCCGTGDHMSKMTYCGSISGGYVKKESNLNADVNFNETVGDGSNESILSKFDPAPYAEWLRDVDEIEVCGLAGDYCVRDTVVALAKMFTDKKIVLLGDFTRYAFLPLFTTGSVPMHKAERHYLESFSPPSRDTERREYVNPDPKKPLNQVVFKSTAPGAGPFRLASEAELNSLPVNDELFSLAPPIGKSLEGINHFHFITDNGEIASDYSDYNNIYVNMYRAE